MGTLKNKIDFGVVFTVKNANPNGDPLNDNRPRETFEGYGEVTDVCLKRKIRNRMQDNGEEIYVQSSDRTTDGYDSLAARAADLIADTEGDKSAFTEKACAKWIDVRAFGQVFAFKNMSVGVRGPVTIQSAYSLSPIDVTTLQITKSVNAVTAEKGKDKSSDTMGHKHRVDSGVYVTFGSMNCCLAEKTGFSDEDAEKVIQALTSLFENDESAARPAGRMEVKKVYVWKHNCKNGQYSSAKVHGMLTITPNCENPKCFEDYTVINATPGDLICEELEG